jgi:oligopeptide transport system ATP-binding protein
LINDKEVVKTGRSIEHEEQKSAPVIELRNLKVHFPVTRGVIFERRVGVVKAVDGVSMMAMQGESLGLIGESGSGKTTIGRTILRLQDPSYGQILFEGEDITNATGGRLRRARRRIGMVFQDPYGSLNPRMSAGRIISEPLSIHRINTARSEREGRVEELLITVGLSPSMASRYPHEFSGGQRQRIGIARALAMRPRLVILDEPVSALDVSIQAQVINLLNDLQAQFNLTYVFIAHDLSVVRQSSDRIVVMYLGKVMEIAERDAFFQNPLHPYSRALLAAVPTPDPVIERKRARNVLKGSIPNPMNPPQGCVFNTRCPQATDECKVAVPELREVAIGHRVACIYVT